MCNKFLATDTKNIEPLLDLVSITLAMNRSFNDWWSTVPMDLKQRARNGDETNKPILNQINYTLLHLHLAGQHEAKPSHQELKDWLHSGQVDVMRIDK